MLNMPPVHKWCVDEIEGEKSLNNNVKVIVCPLAVSFGFGHN